MKVFVVFLAAVTDYTHSQVLLGSIRIQSEALLSSWLQPSKFGICTYSVKGARLGGNNFKFWGDFSGHLDISIFIKVGFTNKTGVKHVSWLWKVEFDL